MSPESLHGWVPSGWVHGGEAASNDGHVKIGVHKKSYRNSNFTNVGANDGYNPSRSQGGLSDEGSPIVNWGFHENYDGLYGNAHGSGLVVPNANYVHVGSQA